VDLVVHEVVELEHVDVANRHLTVELLTGTAVKHGRLTRRLEACLFEHDHNVGFLGAVEDRGRDRHTLGEVFAETHQAVVVEVGDVAVASKQFTDFATERLQVARTLVGADHLVDLLAHAGAGPTQVGFKDLADVHARRHAEWVQHDVN
jgi:hypothetical protein